MYGRAATRKSTGKLIELQLGDGPLGVLTQNAVNAGIPANDINEFYVDQQQFKNWIDSTITPEQTQKQQDTPIARQNIIDAYNAAITDLETIQNTATPTNAQVIWAIKREAQILEYLLKLIRLEF